MAEGEIPNSGPFSEYGGLPGIMTLLQGLFGGGSSSQSDANSPEGLQAAMGLLGPLLGEFNNGDYSPAAADRDSEATVQQIIRQMSETGNPIIQGAEQSGGGYSSTTASLLRNDLASRIVQAGAAEKANTKTKYAAARQAQVSQVLSLIKIIADAHRTQAIQNQTQGLIDNTNARRAAAAAAAASALKGLTQKPQAGGNKPGKGGGGGGGKPGKNDESPAGKDYSNYESGRETEEDARSNDPDYKTGELTDANFPNDDVLGADLRGDNQESNNELNADPFDIFHNEGGNNEDFGDLFGDLDSLGDVDLSNIDLGDIGDIPDFTFEDLPPDFWISDGGSGDGSDGGGGWDMDGEDFGP